MAIIDYDDVTSLRYARLTLTAKALIPVLATLADKNTGLLPERHSKLDTLAAFAGISRRATSDALDKLHKTKRISLTRSHGHPAKIIYLPIAQFSSKAGEAMVASLERQPLPLQDLLNLPSNPRHDKPKLKWQIPCLTGLFKQFKTTTHNSAADRVSLEAVKKARELHGSVVSKILEELRWFNGEVENAEAYFWTCCRTHTIPASKTATARKKSYLGNIKRQERELREQQEQLDLVNQYERERNDPELQAASQKAIEELNTLWADVEPV